MRGFSCKSGHLSGGEAHKEALGHAAVSTAGHDAGKIYFVVGARSGKTGKYLLLSDGRARSFSKPKAKKIKHVAVLKKWDDGVRNALLEGRSIDDSVLVHAVKEVVKDRDRQSEKEV